MAGGCQGRARRARRFRPQFGQPLRCKKTAGKKRRITRVVRWTGHAIPAPTKDGVCFGRMPCQTGPLPGGQDTSQSEEVLCVREPFGRADDTNRDKAKGRREGERRVRMLVGGEEGATQS